MYLLHAKNHSAYVLHSVSVDITHSVAIYKNRPAVIRNGTFMEIVYKFYRGGQIVTMDGVTHDIPKWDLLIAHPPCTYLSNAGACRLYPHSRQLDKKRYAKGMNAKQFFLTFLNADIERIAVENPIPSKVFALPPYTQIIQPYEYGHPYTKKTCLWLKGLPMLKPTNIVKPLGGWVCGNSEIWKRQAASGIVYGKEKDAKHRSKTFEGIAAAMAEQWGCMPEYEVQLTLTGDEV